MQDEIPYGYCHCGCGRKTTICKHTNKKHGQFSGQPHRFISGHYRKPKSVDYRVDDLTGCWVWQRGLVNGHGQILPPEHGTYLAHRAYYIRTYGDIPQDRAVVQTCGNSLCVNPEHLTLTPTREEIFWTYVDKGGSGCWEWLSSKNSAGYGMFFYQHRIQMAHRLAYEWRYGPIARNVYVRHRCLNRGCVNPDHIIIP